MLESLFSSFITNVAPIAMSEGQKLAANIGSKFLITAGTTAGTIIVSHEIDKATRRDFEKFAEEKKARGEEVTQSDADKYNVGSTMGKAAVAGTFGAGSIAAMHFIGKAIDASN